MTSVLIRDRMRRDTEGGSHGRVEVESGAICKPRNVTGARATRTRPRHGVGFPSEPLEGADPANTLVLDFGPAEL